MLELPPLLEGPVLLGMMNIEAMIYNVMSKEMRILETQMEQRFTSQLHKATSSVLILWSKPFHQKVVWWIVKCRRVSSTLLWSRTANQPRKEFILTIPNWTTMKSFQKLDCLNLWGMLISSHSRLGWASSHSSFTLNKSAFNGGFLSSLPAI